jgi:sigma-54-interacting transcriptional regulator
VFADANWRDPCSHRCKTVNLSHESFGPGDMDNRPPRYSEISVDRIVEYRSLRTSHHNVLLEGPDAAVDAAIAALMPYLEEPVRTIPRAAPLELAAERRETLILRDVGALSQEDQNRLIQWLDDSSHRIQIVSTSSVPLFSVLARGLFDVRLYYRLNVMLLRLKSTSDGGFLTHALVVDKSNDWRDPHRA